MLRIRTLGGAVVEGPGGPVGGAASQRKSLALLGLLAAPSDRALSRDKIVAYLWPEIDDARAGHRLTQLLYALRRDLGVDDLFLGSSELRLNPERIESDVREFAAARQAGRLQRAVELYAGPFFDGFFLSEAPEFDRWIENERAGLARDYSEVVEALAAGAGMRGDYRDAVQWWQRLADHDPLSSRVTVHLMSALAATGNRGAALERARSYEETIQRELQAAPNPAIVALADQLRRQPVEGLAHSEPSHSSAVSVAVLPFANFSALPLNDHFAEGLTEELTSALARLEGVRVAARSSVGVFRNADLDAREIGVRLEVSALLEGSVRQAGKQVRLHVQLIDASDGCSLWAGKYERVANDPFAVQDELTALVVAGLRDALADLAKRSTQRSAGRSGD